MINISVSLNYYWNRYKHKINLYIIYICINYAEYNSKKAIIKQNKPVASAKAKPKIA